MTAEDAFFWFRLLIGTMVTTIVLGAAFAWWSWRRYSRRGRLEEYATTHKLSGKDSIHFMCPDCWSVFHRALEQFGELPLCSTCGSRMEAIGFVKLPTEGQK